MARNNEEEEEEKVEPEEHGEEGVYEEESREELEEDDEISPEEEGFMEGYEEQEKVAECALCKKPLLKIEDTVEREYKGEHYRFCSDAHAQKFKFK